MLTRCSTGLLLVGDPVHSHGSFFYRYTLTVFLRSGTPSWIVVAVAQHSLMSFFVLLLCGDPVQSHGSVFFFTLVHSHGCSNSNCQQGADSLVCCAIRYTLTDPSSSRLCLLSKPRIVSCFNRLSLQSPRAIFDISRERTSYSSWYCGLVLFFRYR